MRVRDARERWSRQQRKGRQPALTGKTGQGPGPGREVGAPSLAWHGFVSDSTGPGVLPELQSGVRLLCAAASAAPAPLSCSLTPFHQRHLHAHHSSQKAQKQTLDFPQLVRAPPCLRQCRALPPALTPHPGLSPCFRNGGIVHAVGSVPAAPCPIPTSIRGAACQISPGPFLYGHCLLRTESVNCACMGSQSWWGTRALGARVSHSYGSQGRV